MNSKEHTPSKQLPTSQKLGHTTSTSQSEQKEKTSRPRQFDSIFGQQTLKTMSLAEEKQQEDERRHQQLQADYQSITTEHPEFKRLGEFKTPGEVEMIRHFVDKDIYPPHEICSDIIQIRREAQSNRTQDRKNNRERIFSDSKIIEDALLSSLGEFDIFGESRFDGYDENDEPIYDNPGFMIDVQKSLEFDDRHNHADIICTIQNPDTNHKPIIFAIDATFNTNKLHQKLFKNGKIGFRGRGGTGIQGFTRLKYYEGNDENNPYRPQTKSGMLERSTGLVPLFTIGFSESLAATLGDENAPQHKKQQAANHVAPIIIKELLAQTNANIEALEADISANDPLGPSDRQRIAQHKLQALHEYFSNAWSSCFTDENRRKHLGSWMTDTTASTIVNTAESSTRSSVA